MNCAIVVATYGDDTWRKLAAERAIPSAAATRPAQLINLHQPDGDASSARNAGAQAATADWLCFLDADDELDPGYLAAMEVYERNHDLLLAPYVSVCHRGVRSTPAIPNAGQWPHTNDAVCGTLISRENFLRLGGFDQRFWPWTDWELWLRAIAAGASKIHVPDAVYIVYRRANSENTRITPQQGKDLHAEVMALYPELFE